jgi:L-threonylcarbamoyladenylate synthase
VPREDIENLIGRLLDPDGAAIQAPGMMASHYAPRAKLRLNAKTAEAGEALLAFGPNPSKGSARALCNLSASGDLREAAANLFSMLRQLDKSGANTIAVMPIPDRGFGEAINDRLARAAAPRK